MPSNIDDRKSYKSGNVIEYQNILQISEGHKATSPINNIKIELGEILSFEI